MPIEVAEEEGTPVDWSDSERMSEKPSNEVGRETKKADHLICMIGAGMATVKS